MYLVVKLKVRISYEDEVYISEDLLSVIFLRRKPFKIRYLWYFIFKCILIYFIHYTLYRVRVEVRMFERGIGDAVVGRGEAEGRAPTALASSMAERVNLTSTRRMLEK